MPLPKSHARLYVLIARNAPVAVVFRRGPSKHVLLSKWDLRKDTLEHGQWLKGRIYERRCDLSPDGDLLIYFAANFNRPLESWTAISRPPYLKALAIWEKRDSWGGGGLFSTPSQILLNHRDYQMSPVDASGPPNWICIEPFGTHSGQGEDDPIWSNRLARDGWRLTQKPEGTKNDRGTAQLIEYDPPKIWEKPNPQWPEKWSLRMSILGIGEKNGTWHVIDHELIELNGKANAIGRSDWADWDSNGDLLFAQSGCLYRLAAETATFGPIESSRVIADLNDLPFEPIAAPPEASVWPSKRKS